MTYDKEDVASVILGPRMPHILRSTGNNLFELVNDAHNYTNFVEILKSEADIPELLLCTSFILTQ